MVPRPRLRAARVLAGALVVACSACGGAAPPVRPLPAFEAKVPELGPGTWDVDPAASTLVIDVPPSGIFAFLGHTHAEVVKRWGGAVQFDPARPDATRGVIDVAVDSVRDETPELAEDTRRKLDEETLGEGILDSARFPRARFSLERLHDVRAAGSGRGLVGRARGTLTLHGQAHPVEGPVAASWSAAGVRVAGFFPLPLSRFAIARHWKLLGALGNRDTVLIRYDFVARPRNRVAEAGAAL